MHAHIRTRARGRGRAHAREGGQFVGKIGRTSGGKFQKQDSNNRHLWAIRVNLIAFPLVRPAKCAKICGFPLVRPAKCAKISGFPLVRPYICAHL